jgi:hypothetical protein
VLFAAACCILVGLFSAFGVFLWWRHFQTTPAYALALMIDAAQRDDMEAFAGQIDEEAVAKSIIADLSQRAAGHYGLTLSSTLHRQVEKLLPTLLPEFKQIMHREMVKEIQEFSGKAEHRPFIVIALAVTRFVNITAQGNSAKATATVHDRKVEIAMHHDNERWKVVDFKDDVMTQKIVETVLKDLPAIGGFDLGNIVKPGKKRPDSAQTH